MTIWKITRIKRNNDVKRNYHACKKLNERLFIANCIYYNLRVKCNERIEWVNALLRKSQHDDNRDCHEHIGWDAHKIVIYFRKGQRTDAKSVFSQSISQGKREARLIYARGLPLKIRDARLSLAQLGDFRTARSMTDVIFYPRRAR